MSELLIVGGAGFVGSNIANYAVQHTKFDVATVDSLIRQPDFLNLAPAMAAKSRHSFYLAEAENSHIMKRLFEIESPQHIIYNAFVNTEDPDQVYHNFETFRKFLSVVHQFKDTQTLIVLFKDYYSNPIAHEKLQSMVSGLMEESSVKHWYLVNSCELFGPRQSKSGFIPQNITGLFNEEVIVADPSNTPRELMYIRDYFQAIMSLVEGEMVLENGIYRVFSGSSATDEDIFKFMSYLIKGGPEHKWIVNQLSSRPAGIDLPVEFKSELTDALEHTAAWYSHNKWSWSVEWKK